MYNWGSLKCLLYEVVVNYPLLHEPIVWGKKELMCTRMSDQSQQMLDRTVVGSSWRQDCKTYNANLFLSSCADLRNMGRPVLGGCSPSTKIFIGTESL